MTQFNPDARPADFSDLARRVRALEHALAYQRSSPRQLEAATIGKGGLQVRAPGDFTIVDDDGNPIWSASASPIKVGSAGAAESGLTFPTSFPATPYAQCDLLVPPGYQAGVFNLYVAAGLTATAGGVGANVGVTPAMIMTSGSSAGTYYGAGVSNGVAAGLGGSAVSVWNVSFSLPEPNTAGFLFRAGASAYGNNDVDAGSCNVHVSASALYLRAN